MTANVTKSAMQQIYNVLIPPGILSKRLAHFDFQAISH